MGFLNDLPEFLPTLDTRLLSVACVADTFSASVPILVSFAVFFIALTTFVVEPFESNAQISCLTPHTCHSVLPQSDIFL